VTPSRDAITMTAPVFKNGEWLLPDDHEEQERQRERGGLGGSNFQGNKAIFERAGGTPVVPRGMGGDLVDPRQVNNRKAMLGEFMKAANIPINDPINEEAGGINAPKIPESGGRGEGGYGGGYGGGGGRGGAGGVGGGRGSGGQIVGNKVGIPYFQIGDKQYENPTPGNTIRNLPDDLRQVLIDWAHEQDRIRNDGSVSGAAPHDPMGNLMRLPHDAQSNLLHPKKRYYTDSNHYDTRDKSFPENVNQKQSAKNIAETLLTGDERAHDLFKTTIARNYDDRMENYIRNTRWKVGVDGYPEYPTPVKDYLTHRFLAIDATQPVVTNHHQHIFTKNEFEHHHHTERAPHGGVTPEQAYKLIMGLKDENNRGAGMFEEARRRAEKHVIDESNRKEMARRPISPTVEKMLSEVNEPKDMALFNAANDLAETNKDKKIDELMQIIRAQQGEIARLRAAVNASEIPASPMASSTTDVGSDLSNSLKQAAAKVAPATPVTPVTPLPPPSFDHEWSKKHWPFATVA